MTAVLRTAIGRYPHTEALWSGRVASDMLRLEFEAVTPISCAFAPMVREGRFDVSEMAIATFLQARAYGKPLTLLPIALAARFQEAALLCRADSDIAGPADLAGRRVGVRAYSQTTGLWLRGILQDAHGLRPERMRWVTFEDAHVREFRDPPWAERAAPGQDMLAMLRQGSLNAAILGNDVPDDPALRTVFPDPGAAGEAFWRRHRFVPVNHMLTVRSGLLERRPELAPELLRMFRASQALAPAPAGGRGRLPCTLEALNPAVELAASHAWDQGLLPHRVHAGKVWDVRHDAAQPAWAT